MTKTLIALFALAVVIAGLMTACAVNEIKHSKVATESAQRYIEENEDRFVKDMANYLATQHFTLTQTGAPALQEIVRAALAEGDLSSQSDTSRARPSNKLKRAKAPSWRIGPGWNVQVSTSLTFSVPDPNPDNPTPRFRALLYHNVLVDTETGAIISVKPHKTKRYLWVTYSNHGNADWYAARNN